MAQLQDVKDLLARLDTATNAVAEKLKQTASQIEDGLTGEQEEAVVADLRAAAERLEALAADPEDPVPAEPPAEPEPPIG